MMSIFEKIVPFHYQWITKSKIIFLCGLFLYISISSYLSILITRKDPEAIMDEVHHIPQANLYCGGIYDKWSPLITTLPGLYIFSVGPLKIVQTLLNISCSVFVLRSFNLLVNVINFIIISQTVEHYQKTLNGFKKMIITISLAIFPLHYFFTFFYYTDPLSTCWILLMHLFCIKKFYRWSSFAGFCAIITRQTSVVWVCYHGVLTLHSILKAQPSKTIYDAITYADYKGLTGKRLEWKQHIQAIIKELVFNILPVNNEVKNVNNNDTKLMRTSDTDKANIKLLREELLNKTSGYILVGIIFAVFVYVNKGVVVGDRENHQLNINTPQLLYFTLFTGIFLLPHLASQSKQIFHFFTNNLILTIIITLVSTFMVHFNTVAHPYNFAGPHHFTHHFLKAIFNFSLLRYLLIPIYTICSLFIIENLNRSVGRSVSFIYFIAISLNLVPQLLLEFRYYVPAFFLFRINMQSKKLSVLISELVLYLIVNGATVLLYLIRPTLFENETVQICMW